MTCAFYSQGSDGANLGADWRKDARQRVQTEEKLGNYLGLVLFGNNEVC